VYMLNPEIKYQGTLDMDTTLKFTIANYDNEKTGAAITATVVNPEMDCTADYKTITKNCGTIGKNGFCEYDSLEISGWPWDFCWKAKTFDVTLSYSGGTKNFRLECPTANPDVKGTWSGCSETASIGISAGSGSGSGGGAGGGSGSGGGGGSGSGTPCPTSTAGYMCTDPATCSSFGGHTVAGSCTAAGEICCAEPGK
jgi:uncharacterized membrane protein YgcG